MRVVDAGPRHEGQEPAAPGGRPRDYIAHPVTVTSTASQGAAGIPQAHCRYPVGVEGWRAAA